jgi:hypothetical protein
MGMAAGEHYIPTVLTDQLAIGSTLPKSSTLLTETIFPVSRCPLVHMGQLRSPLKAHPLL